VVTDPANSVRARVGAASSLESRTFSYFPFGQERETAGQAGAAENADVEKFGSYQRSGTTMLDYAKQRYYYSTLARFLTLDRAEGSAKPIHPDSWNRYSLVNNDPVNFFDASGLSGGSYTYTTTGTHTSTYTHTSMTTHSSSHNSETSHSSNSTTSTSFSTGMARLDTPMAGWEEVIRDWLIKWAIEKSLDSIVKEANKKKEQAKSSTKTKHEVRNGIEISTTQTTSCSFGLLSSTCTVKSVTTLST
jgi:RHS repeat-associated protein